MRPAGPNQRCPHRRAGRSASTSRVPAAPDGWSRARCSGPISSTTTTGRAAPGSPCRPDASCRPTRACSHRPSGSPGPRRAASGCRPEWTSRPIPNTDSHCAREGETRPLLRNARWLPLVIAHGVLDEFVPIPSVLQQVFRLDRLGYRYRFTVYPVTITLDRLPPGTEVADRRHRHGCGRGRSGGPASDHPCRSRSLMLKPLLSARWSVMLRHSPKS